jgi:hypothetical protein
VDSPCDCVGTALDIKPKFVEAFRRLLQPLVRILLRNGVSFAEFVETTKEVFVEESIKDCWERSGDCSISRISVVTGLTRREVGKIVGSWAEDAGDSDRSRMARISRMLTGWSTDPHYVGPYGWPVDVPFDSTTEIAKPNFVDLVKKYAGVVSPDSMLRELLHLDVVRRLESGLLRLENRAYIPGALTNESVNRLSTVVSNVIQTLDYNVRVEREEDHRFERTVAADHGLSGRQIPKFSAFLKERGAEFLEELDAWMAGHPPGTDEERLGVGVGVYLFVEHPTDRFSPAEHGLRSPLAYK